MRCRTLGSIVALCTLSSFFTLPAFTPPAQAEESSNKKRAKVLFDRGMSEYESGHYAEAIESYRAAYELLPLPLIMFDLAQAYRLSGERPKAIELYEKYLDVEPKGRAAPEARLRLGELREAAVLAQPPPKPAPVITPVAPEPVPSPQPVVTIVQPPPAAPAPPAKRPKWIWGVVGGVVAVVVVGVGVGLGVGLGGSDHYPSASYGSGVLK